MEFVLMDGTGNRFLVLDAFRHAPPADEALPSLARDLCRRERLPQTGSVSDRSNGSCADGLLIAEPAKGYAGRMRVYNADGSIAEMCGNGLRCVGKLLFDRGHAGERFVVATDAGPRDVEVLSASDETSDLRIGLGKPVFDPALIPTTLSGTPPIEQPIDIDGESWLVTCVSMGNPHAVTFIADPEIAPVEGVGRMIERHAVFPHRTNVEFASIVSPAAIRLRVWERGVGEAAACGTGAAATAVAAILTGRTQRDVTIHLRGGDLQISWPSDDAEVSLTGPAKIVDVVNWASRDSIRV
ncbi:MAG: diaminopimelate epimerase [Planctomycetaceae bacterium]|nr:diaminopimelate epimerase [Planctomycetaceae bacterium]